MPLLLRRLLLLRRWLALTNWAQSCEGIIGSAEILSIWLPPCEVTRVSESGQTICCTDSSLCGLLTKVRQVRRRLCLRALILSRHVTSTSARLVALARLLIDSEALVVARILRRGAYCRSG